MAKFLVTGGAGYVGSHLVLELTARGHDVVVLDRLSQGHRAAVLPPATLVEGEVADTALLDRVMAGQGFAAVFHFASLTLVGESMRVPLRYIAENGLAGIALIEACLRHGVPKFVLSSTANLFNAAGHGPIPEDAPIDPGSAYGESKHVLERALLWADRVHGLRSACLRYFNAAGADPAGRLGEDHDPETHLVPLVIDAALGRRDAIVIFGTDWPTPDGTCIRDYVHVTDLADAHVRALDLLERGSVRFNLGTGAGHSVREVIAAVARATGRAVPVREGPRRAGDPAVLVAAPGGFQAATGWAPRFAGLDTIVRTAAAWREAHPKGYDDRPG